MKMITLFAVALIAGCSMFDPQPYELKRDTVTIRVQERPLMMEFDAAGNASNPLGYAQMQPDGTCVISLQAYPVCLAHEVRHCLEGEWHPKHMRNVDDCWE